MPLPRTRSIAPLLRVSTALTAASVLSAPANALPTGGQVVGGQASVDAGPGRAVVTQLTDRGIIHWDTFDVAPGELVQFRQPSTNSVTLNRVTGGRGASQIQGGLTANGTVVLVNPNGVIFGPNSHVNVGSLVATTADIADDRFMAGDLRFDRPGSPDGRIENHGTVTIADSGLGAFVGPAVRNDGVITATLGKVALASGDTFALDLYGDGLIQLAASDQLKSQLVSNSGTISAQGGKVVLTAAAATEVVDSLINMDGIVQANSVGLRNGEIVIYAEGSHALAGNDSSQKGRKSGSSTVLVSGVLDASGRNPGERGGNITVTGDHVALLDGTRIDASGHTGLSGTTEGKAVSAYRDGSAGGDIRIGGDYLGTGDTPAAQNLYVDAEATILNDALSAGDAGRTILWSDGTTQFNGHISARASGTSGDGGFVETSGKDTLKVGDTARVDTRAAAGANGEWLLDPKDYVIAASGGDMTGATLSANLGTGNVTILSSGGGGNGNGDILVGDTVSWSANTLTLTAPRLRRYRVVRSPPAPALSPATPSTSPRLRPAARSPTSTWAPARR